MEWAEILQNTHTLSLWIGTLLRFTPLGRRAARKMNRLAFGRTLEKRDNSIAELKRAKSP